MTTMYDTTPTVSSTQAADPLEDAGSLEQKDKQQKKKTKYEVMRDKIHEVTGTRRMADVMQFNATPITDSLADVESFAKLIDDRLTTFDDIKADTEPSGNAVIISFTLPPKDCDEAEHNGYGAMEMRPTPSFWSSLARFANDRTHIRSLTRGLMMSLTDQVAIGSDNKADRKEAVSEARDIAIRLTNHIFDQLCANYTRHDKDMDETKAKAILLRMLKPDPKGRWPKKRSVRALLAANYRDDISHQWLMRQMAELIPDGGIRRYYFNGDLLKGAVLIPSIARTEHDSDYGGGLFFFSGEVGNRRAGVMPFLYRAATGAVTIVGKDWGVTHHRSDKMEQLAANLSAYVHEQIPLVSTHLRRLLDAKDITFADTDPFTIERLLLAIRSSFTGQFSNQDLRLWKVAVEAEKNIFPVLALSAFVIQNGLTRMSQTVADPVRQIQLDTTAGRLLDLEWDKIVARSQTVSDEQVIKVFPE